ncbi:hypothetical protein [Vibrio owensii]|uniref:hypothetical protein n=1 Tax=Vibrio harveyi group TaxID=717610 RepID=UPI003CC5FCAF
MFDLDGGIKTAQQQIETAQTNTASMKSKVDTASATSEELTLGLDVETARLEEVRQNNDSLNENMVTMILELDGITTSMGDDFSSMRENTGFEKFIGIFSRQKSQEMRATRISSSDISTKLNDLIVQSRQIGTMLEQQETVLKDQIEKGNTNLQSTIDNRKSTIEELVAVEKEIDGLDPQIIQLERSIAEEADKAKRTELEDQLTQLNRRFNELQGEQQKLTVRSQTLERYIDMNKTNIDSLNNQLTGQTALIDKLDTDTKQRVVLYEQYEQSLKTADQQTAAHRINEIGTAVDAKQQEGMAFIGSASQNRTIEMMEKHEGDMAMSRELMEKKARADERFFRRFEKVIEKHNAGNYNQ